MHSREPRITPVPVAELRPTQMTVGMREVQEKRKSWRAREADGGASWLGKHLIPVLLGPKGRPYVIDHHHLARALMEEGVEDVATTVVADLSMLGKDEFWVFIDNRAWCHPYDEDGKRRSFDDIPRSIKGLKDDPFRSLAGELRRAGGFAKEVTPFSEFLWADFLRRRIKATDVRQDFGAALSKALRLAKSPKAGYLPGWCGPAADN
jgi:hypothetical protein